MPEVVANGLKHCYEITGEGATTIVWIHGIGGSHHYWDEVLPDFPGFRHLSYDVRGMGDSEGSEGPVSLEDWAADCASLMDELGIEQAIIGGTSMGGAITMRFGIDFPEKVKALLLLSTSSRVGQAATDHWMAQADDTEKGGNPLLAAAQRSVAKYNMDEAIKNFDVPALIVVGDADKTTPAGGSV
ncbi:MAG: alpha/beta fold hydrolase, partial [Dehalococcoidia bacterium]|nr:alpha/beta fold hydrolase [Dehalococcoidia bacterium]